MSDFLTICTKIMQVLQKSAQISCIYLHMSEKSSIFAADFNKR